MSPFSLAELRNNAKNRAFCLVSIEKNQIQCQDFCVRLNVLTALFCLLSLFVELAFDTSTAFVRSDAPVAHIASSGSSSHDSGSSGSDNHDDPWAFNSASHASGPVLEVVVVEPLDDVSRFEPSFLLIAQEGDLFVPLRPPIAANQQQSLSAAALDDLVSGANHRSRFSVHTDHPAAAPVFAYNNTTHKDFEMIAESIFKNGETEQIESWFKNGNKMLEAQTRNGQVHGQYRLFHDNGNVMLDGEWKEGHPDGLTRTYHRNGKIKQEVNFSRGQFHGVWREWDVNGQLVVDGYFENGSRVEWRILGDSCASHP